MRSGGIKNERKNKENTAHKKKKIKSEEKKGKLGEYEEPHSHIQGTTILPF